MEHHEMCALRELKGRLQGRAHCLECDIRATQALVSKLETEKYEAYFHGKIAVLEEWASANACLLAEVERIIKSSDGEEQGK